MEGLVELHRGVTCTSRFRVPSMHWKKQRFSHRFLWLWIILCSCFLTICPAVTCRHQDACRIWALQTADNQGNVYIRGISVPGSYAVLVLLCQGSDLWWKWISAFCLDLCLWGAVREGCCLLLTGWIMSLLFLSRNVLSLQVKRGCLKEIYLQCSDLHSQWIWS